MKTVFLQSGVVNKENAIDPLQCQAKKFKKKKAFAENFRSLKNKI